MKIFLATGNKKKINEITKNLDGNLDGNKYEILSINDGIEIPEVVEDGDTFEANSQKKALEIAKFTGMVTIADDSGLCVDALNGAPGIYSARYSGEDATDEENNELLIKNLSGIENRAAKFVCVISLAKPNGEVYSFRGEYEGEIIDTPRGGVGFGYDPYFYVKEYGKTFAEMPEIKVKVSHRARALEKLKLGIENILKNC